MSSAQNISPQDLHVPTGFFVDQDYCIKVYVHRIGKDDGSGALTAAEIGNPVDGSNSLNVYFSGTGRINFYWDGQILEINDTNIYNSNIELSSPGPLGKYTYDFDLLDDYSHNDGIDLFIHGNEQLGSIADGIADETQVLITPGHLNTPGITHEVGHVLGLFHTYHGTAGGGSPFGENSDNFGTHITECPANPSNASGDYVSDTDADNGEDTPDGNCTRMPSNDGNVCSVGYNFPEPDLKNFMRPTNLGNNVPNSVVSCSSEFTTGQYNRMKFFIYSQPHLSAVLNNYCRGSECETKPCDMAANFIANIDECAVNFNGTNDGVYCPNQTYSWVIKNSSGNTITTSNQEDFNFTFPATGNYTASFTITNPAGGHGCSNTITKPISVTCGFIPPPPPCPTNLELFTSVNCEDAQVWINAAAGVNYVDFYYTLGNYNHVSLGRSYGNQSNQFSKPIYLPNPPSSGSWNGYVLSAYAQVVMDDSTVICSEIVTRQRLSCSSGQWWRSSLSIYPNPSKPNSELQFEGINIKDVKFIELFDLFGNSKMKLRPNKNSFKVPRLQSGIYIVKFYTSKGIEQKKLIIE